MLLICTLGCQKLFLHHLKFRIPNLQIWLLLYQKGQSHGVVECGGRLVADIDLGGQNRGSWQKISSSHLKGYMRDERIG